MRNVERRSIVSSLLVEGFFVMPVLQNTFGGCGMRKMIFFDSSSDEGIIYTYRKYDGSSQEMEE